MTETAPQKETSQDSAALSSEQIKLNSQVNRKMDLAMLPLLSLVYLFNGLDKGNIGNAETQGTALISAVVPPCLQVCHSGFTKAIGAAPSDLNLAVSLFYITFVLFQPPSAAIGRWIGPNYWIGIMAVRNTCILKRQN